MSLLSKTLVTVSNIKDFLDASGCVLCQSNDMIITPLAQDYCRKHRIQITTDASFNRQQKEEKSPVLASDSGQDRKVDSSLPLDHQVKQLIRKEFGIVREDQVQAIARVVLRILKEKA